MSFDLYVYAREPLPDAEWPLLVGDGLFADVEPGRIWVAFVDVATGEIIGGASGPLAVDEEDDEEQRLPYELQDASGVRWVYEFNCSFEYHCLLRTTEVAERLAERLEGWQYDPQNDLLYGPDGDPIERKITPEEEKDASAEAFIQALPGGWRTAKRVALVVMGLFGAAFAVSLIAWLILEALVGTGVHKAEHLDVLRFSGGCLAAGCVADLVWAWLGDRYSAQVRRSLPAWHAANPRWRSVPKVYRKYAKEGGSLVGHICLPVFPLLILAPILAFAPLGVDGMPWWWVPMCLAVIAACVLVMWLLGSADSRRVKRQEEFQDAVFHPNKET
ncbi:MAG: hypothetical protein LBR27_10320 [Bifidobacteriaceae bacterium]|jgi:hypothetical protein|nr:hypothetical protein [Bifidobacteriaceae bacterium]